MSARPPLPKRPVPPLPKTGIANGAVSQPAAQEAELYAPEEGTEPQASYLRPSSILIGRTGGDSPSTGLAACFGDLQLKRQSQRAVSSNGPARPPPPLPPRRASGDIRNPIKPSLTGENDNNTPDVDRVRLIARKPPPRPISVIGKPSSSPASSVPPSPVRPVPPLPPRLPQRSIPPPPHRHVPVPPSLPRRPSAPIQEPDFEPEQAQSGGQEIYDEDETARAPELPQRRLPPMPTRRATPPPPPINLSTKPAMPAMQVSEVDSDPQSCLKCHDFSAVDHHASLFPRHNVTSLAALARDLTQPFASETEKARALFTWMHFNIQYDVQSFFSGNIQHATPESTLRSGLAVCGGYAGLFVYLGKLAGLKEVHQVTGHGKGFGYSPMQEGEPLPAPHAGHAWNCVLLDGEWRLLDPCWGAGAVTGTSYNQRFDPYWFTADPVEFGKRHYPTEDPTYQLMPAELGGPVSWEDYVTEPARPIIFGPFSEQYLDVHKLEPEWGIIEGGGMVTFSVYKRCEHMSTAEEDNFIFLISTADKARTPLAPNAVGGWSATVHVPRGAEMSLYYVTSVNNRDAKGLSLVEYNRAVGRQPMQFGGLARWNAV